MIRKTQNTSTYTKDSHIVPNKPGYIKQRLIGLITLFSLAAIFIPMLLHENPQVPAVKQLIPNMPNDMELVPLEPESLAKIEIKADNAESALASPLFHNPASVDLASTEAPVKNSTTPTEDKLQPSASNNQIESANNLAQNKIKEQTPNKAPETGIIEKKTISAKVPDSKNPVNTKNADVKVSDSKVMANQPTDSKVSANKVLDSRSVWALKVAVFSLSSNAINLEKDLQKEGFKAYTKTHREGDKTLYTIYVGPEIKKERLTELSKVILQKFQIEGRIVPFKVE